MFYPIYARYLTPPTLYKFVFVNLLTTFGSTIQRVRPEGAFLFVCAVPCSSLFPYDDDDGFL